MNLIGSLKTAARKSGMSMNEISRRTGLAYQIVHGFLKGERDIAISSAVKLADVLDLELRPKATKGGK
ncbi:MAG: helix-turn-helix transcriptional regulator [Phycisphaerales bacterium]|nr:helix-turn-helix transcriptional regulator [Phycisphaerales bacterium]